MGNSGKIINKTCCFGRANFNINYILCKSFIMKNTYLIVIPIYRGVDLMDVCAPKEIFGWIDTTCDGRKAEVLIVAKDNKPVVTRDGTLLLANATFDSPRAQEADLLWIPGGAPDALARLIKKPHGKYFNYLNKIGAGAEYLCSVCEGAVLFAETGFLNGHDATTHWAFYPCMEKYKEINMVPDYPRYVHSGNRITGGGISSGLDQAYYVTSLIAGSDAAQQAALMMQYDPQVEFPIHITAADSCPIPCWPL